MQRHACLRIVCLGVFCAALAMTVPVADVIAQPGHKNGQSDRTKSHGKERRHERKGDKKPRKDGGQMSAQQAARQAQQRYGGQVLKVDQQGSGYQVRLLQDDGRVITVSIGG